MQRARRRHVPGWLGFAGAVGALILVPTLSGCPGTLDPDVAKMAGSGGSNGSGTGGSTGTGGANPVVCTGDNDGATIIGKTCAQMYCHDASGAGSSGGLDLTLDAGIGSRLVGVVSTGTLSSDNSFCGGTTTEPYLVPNSNPATGLLIDKTKSTVPCGQRMPEAGSFLTTMQTTCLIQWATTLTSP